MIIYPQHLHTSNNHVEPQLAWHTNQLGITKQSAIFLAIFMTRQEKEVQNPSWHYIQTGQANGNVGNQPINSAE